MSTKIEISGDYSQKTEVGPIVLSHHKGTFDITKDVANLSWSEPLGGGATLSESVKDGKVSVTVSFLGQSVVLFHDGALTGHNNFKIELDSGNFVKGQIKISA